MAQHSLIIALAAKYELPGPMSTAELAFLPRMIANGNLYVLNWDITAYYEDKAACDDDEYLMYLEHQIKVMSFIESHLDEIGAIIASAEDGTATGGMSATSGSTHESEVSV